MRYFIVILLSFLPALAMAQDEGAGPITECAEVLASPPFDDILTRNEGNDFHELSPLRSGRALLGLECSVDELTEFFENAGWEFLDFREQRLAGPFGGQGGIPKYYVDAVADFCQKRPTLFGRFFYSCRPIAAVLFHEGRVSSIIVFMSK
ncbi:MAG: hypothetical protein JKY41_09915 [Rhodobacteraceae bacterium]|nr:hypothetical protein [Paracoccaceae bacterium]